MYAYGNPKTKKSLKDMVAVGKKVGVFSPGPFPCPQDGVVFLEGPYYPAAHTWYAKAVVEKGIIISVK